MERLFDWKVKFWFKYTIRDNEKFSGNGYVIVMAPNKKIAAILGQEAGKKGLKNYDKVEVQAFVVYEVEKALSKFAKNLVN